MTELRRKMDILGLRSLKGHPLALQTIANILGNPFYCGLMRIKGQLYPHSYPALIEQSVFDACQKRKRRAQMPQQDVKKTKYRLPVACSFNIGFNRGGRSNPAARNRPLCGQSRQSLSSCADMGLVIA